MVLGKKVAIFVGNGAEIRPLEKGRKCPEFIVLPCAMSRRIDPADRQTDIPMD